MAYLKAHHPVEFMGALLAAWTGVKDKEPAYVIEARRMNLTIAKADVNRSDVVWKSEGGKLLRRGLLSVKTVGEGAAQVIVTEREDNGHYADLDDLVARVPARPVTGAGSYKKTKDPEDLVGVLAALRDAGALRSLGVVS
jgi:DNA polymerase-3 subunit alpha